MDVIADTSAIYQCNVCMETLTKGIGTKVAEVCLSFAYEYIALSVINGQFEGAVSNHLIRSTRHQLSDAVGGCCNLLAGVCYVFNRDE